MRHFLLVLLFFPVLHTTAQNFSLQFDGTNQYVEIPDQNSIDPGNDFTIEAWIYPTGNGSTSFGGAIICKESSYVIDRFQDGTLQFAIADGITPWAWKYTGSIAPLNTWTHLALVKSGTTVIFYLNGSISVTYPAQPVSVATNNENLWIGGRSNFNHFFTGKIDDVRIWNTARSQAEIKAYAFNKNLSQNAAGLAAWYKMNEGSGAITSNSCTNSSGIDGTLQFAPTWAASPVQFGANAVSFDGTDDYISIADNNSLDITTAITLEAWVYAIKNSGTQNVISKSSSSANNGYIFPRTGDGWNNVQILFHIAGGWKILSASYPSRNAWHHLAATYDGSTMRLYIDGQLEASTPQTGTITTNNNALVIGNQTGFLEYFGGYADEVRIWNVARTETEIQNNMFRELNPATQTGLVSYYTFNQGIVSGTNTGIISIMDQKGNNNGTMNNFALSGGSSNFISQLSGIGILPVSWLHFSAQIKGDAVQLNWSTANEQNSRDFILQHSSNGSDYTNIGKLFATGSSTTNQQYSFVHARPVIGINYYRIEQRDLDGRSTYSKVVTVIYTAEEGQITVYPNPVTGGQLYLQLPKAATIALYNMAGELVMMKKLGAGSQQVDISCLPNGIYQLKSGFETQQIFVR